MSITCGGGADDEPTSGVDIDVHVHLDEWSVTAEPLSIEAGAGIAFQGHNHGKFPHQLTAVRTDLDPAALPISKSRVDLSGIGEPVVAFDVPAADGDEGTQIATAELGPGRYVLYCAIPGHYQQGMYGALEVTGAQQ